MAFFYLLLSTFQLRAVLGSSQSHRPGFKVYAAGTGGQVCSTIPLPLAGRARGRYIEARGTRATVGDHGWSCSAAAQPQVGALRPGRLRVLQPLSGNIDTQHRSHRPCVTQIRTRQPQAVTLVANASQGSGLARQTPQPQTQTSWPANVRLRVWSSGP